MSSMAIGEVASNQPGFPANAIFLPKGTIVVHHALANRLDRMGLAAVAVAGFGMLTGVARAKAGRRRLGETETERGETNWE
jgi:hypothetical protein